MPCSAMALANPAMKGWSIPAPAPWATTSVATAPPGPIEAAPTGPDLVSISLRTSGVTMSGMIVPDGGHALHGDFRIRLRRVEARRLLPGRAEERRHALVLREQVPLGGGQLHVPPVPHGEDPGRLAGGHAAGVRVHAQGEPADHALQAPGRCRRRRPRLPAAGEAPRRSPGDRAVPVPADPEVRQPAHRAVRRIAPTRRAGRDGVPRPVMERGPRLPPRAARSEEHTS